MSKASPSSFEKRALEAEQQEQLKGATALGAWRPLPQDVITALTALTALNTALNTTLNTPPRSIDPLTALTPLAPSLNDLPSLPLLPRAQHLCVGLEAVFEKGGPPTIAWRAHESPALRWPPPPLDAQDLLLLLIDWDTPQHTHWERLNSAHLTPLTPQAISEVRRAPFVLWASVGLGLQRPQAPLSALKGLPRGFGGRGWALEGREAGYFAQGGKATPLLSSGYSALNDYSGWFKGSKLSGAYGGYGGPCIPLGDPQPHRVSALLFALTEEPPLPSHGAPALSAIALLKRALQLPSKGTIMVSRFDWRAVLPHDHPLPSPQPAR